MTLIQYSNPREQGHRKVKQWASRSPSYQGQRLHPSQAYSHTPHFLISAGAVCRCVCRCGVCAGVCAAVLVSWHEYGGQRTTSGTSLRLRQGLTSVSGSGQYLSGWLVPELPGICLHFPPCCRGTGVPGTHYLVWFYMASELRSHLPSPYTCL